MQLNNTAIIKAKPLHFTHKIQPEALFEHFADQPWAMWLDSCQSDHIDSRYDIMVWQPEITLMTTGENTVVHYVSEQRSTTSTDDPLLLLQSVQNTFFKHVEIQSAELPFLTGAAGYFSYDLGRRFEQLPSQALKDINMPEMAVGLYSQALIYDKKTQQFSLIARDDKRDEIETFLMTIISQKNSKTELPFQLTKNWQANMTQLQYQEKFEQIQQYLLSGDCYQINLTQRFTAHYQGEEFQAYQALRKANQAPFSAFIRLENFSILSISPERFLRVIDNKVQSKPIKGTKARSTDKACDEANAIALKNSEKDQAENLMIVDLLRNDMSKVCVPGTVKVPMLFEVESFPAVHHLVSTVEGELENQFDAIDLLRGSFPGGSITGAPKIRAMEIIDELEPQRRSIYCGSIGYISACGNMDTSITIRTLVCENTDNQQTIHCWAGGGIVADSNVDAEYQESFDKVNKILPILEKL
ncbi:MAG: aminodeoxychorismate synthase component I [Thalassotalea sp.]|nr:aminodeoxychorismate synthase component I [Thalassotalea sp.]